VEKASGERFEDIEARQLDRELTCKLNERKNPERFTLLNRVPFGKFNRVNPEPLNVHLCFSIKE
jgi:hypothetical protein